MDLSQMRYVVEIARCGSISRAAKILYMGQPNLSKSLRELEKELGCPLFRRTPHGIEPTRAGEEFLLSAREILGEVDRLTRLYQLRSEKEIRLSLCTPRASYISAVFCRWAKQNVNGHFLLQYRETNAAETIQSVFSGDAQLGIVRYHTKRADYFEGLASTKGLHLAPLWNFHMVVLMHKDHPLASVDQFSLSRLLDYPEILHGDVTVSSPENLSPTAQNAPEDSHILVYDRASQFDILRSVRGSFMWVSPMPEEILQREHLVQKSCQCDWTYRDAAVWKGHLLPAASTFLQEIHEEIHTLVQA